jgi:hypothetical protein
MTPQKAYIAHLGDSPILIFKNTGSGYEIKFRTVDHDIHTPAERARLIQANPMVRFNGNYMLIQGNKIMTVRGFGDYTFNNPRFYPGHLIKETGGLIGRIPDISVIDLDPSDLIIATSDGLMETINQTTIGPGRDEQEICEDAWHAQVSGIPSIAQYLIDKKIQRLTTLYMEKSKIDPLHPQRKAYQQMLEQNMDNHVIITHVISDKIKQLAKTSLKRAYSL